MALLGLKDQLIFGSAPAEPPFSSQKA